MQGFLVVNKPKGVTSAFVVNKIKRKLNIKRVGHLGTLDPLATGVLPVAIGKATRLFDYFLNKEKEYIVELEFGYETNTLDIDGEINKKTNIIPSKIEIENVINEFIGKQMQIPPKFSAKNINGKRAYDLARSGVEFELKPKEIEIYNFSMLKEYSEKKYSFIVLCSSGTYIRSLVRDLAFRLNSLATMTNLVRTKSGNFTLESSFDLDILLADSKVDEKIISIEEILPFEVLEVSDKDFSKLKNGVKVNVGEIKNKSVLVKNNNILLGVGEIYNNVLTITIHLLEEK